jgi:hypothetical protein
MVLLLPGQRFPSLAGHQARRRRAARVALMLLVRHHGSRRAALRTIGRQRNFLDDQLGPWQGRTDPVTRKPTPTLFDNAAERAEANVNRRHHPAIRREVELE